MLLTLSANSLRSLLVKGRAAKPKLDLLDLPQVAREELGLHGLSLTTDLLAGAQRERFDRLRERADKAGCACLLLIESEPQPMSDPSEATGKACIDRLVKVIQAGSILGCNAVALRLTGTDNPEHLQRTVERMKKAVERAEKLEINVLIWPGPGLTAVPERVTDIIKKVGGFRVGTLPDFETAAAAPDPVAYLRRLTPYASSVLASSMSFTGPKGEPAPDELGGDKLRHAPYELGPLVEAILSVGYDASLSIEYRGTGDAKLGVIRTRQMVDRLLGADADMGDLELGDDFEEPDEEGEAEEGEEEEAGEKG